ncbi:hypothetical protein CPB85DRAFT_1252510 [Mucidula mucida]|nr:hypothetical protein CPB85DRAFT_1252510 [Mucidula mucida]
MTNRPLTLSARAPTPVSFVLEVGDCGHHVGALRPTVHRHDFSPRSLDIAEQARRTVDGVQFPLTPASGFDLLNRSTPMVELDISLCTEAVNLSLFWCLSRLPGREERHYLARRQAQGWQGSNEMTGLTRLDIRATWQAYAGMACGVTLCAEKGEVDCELSR